MSGSPNRTSGFRTSTVVKISEQQKLLGLNKEGKHKIKRGARDKQRMQQQKGSHRGLEVTCTHGDRVVRSSNLSWSSIFAFLHLAKIATTLKSNWSTGVGKIPAMTSSCNLPDVEKVDLRWELGKMMVAYSIHTNLYHATIVK